MPLNGRLRLTELLASLSLATDLGTGQPLGHGMRTCQLAVAIGRKMGCDADELRSLLQVGLLRFLGCTADAAETAEAVGGDDLALNATMSPVFVGGSWEGVRALAQVVGRGEPRLRRVRLLLGMLGDKKALADGLAAHCEVASMLARRLDLDDRVVVALGHAYERWDGKGYPDRLVREQIPFEVRVCTVARDVDLFVSAGKDPVHVLKARRGKGYDPTVVDAWLAMDQEHPEADWDALMATEPEPRSYREDVDVTLTVLADFVDLKSPWTRGHSRRVAELARRAGEEAGMPQDEVERLERAGLIHDVGRAGVENGVWDRPGPLTFAEWEKVRLHPYLTARILGRCPALADLGRVAASHHERLDGSGYHTGATSDEISSPGRFLAAADVLAALLSDRPNRAAHERDEAFSILREEAGAGRLDSDAVACVIAAAGGESRRPPSRHPDGLTDREVEVLRHISSGRTNREVAGSLYISAKTVGRHVENIYAKIGVSTRAGAAVYAMEHELL